MRQATPFDALTLGEYLERGLRVLLILASLAGSLYLALCLGSYSPQDPGWSHLGPDRGVQNLGGTFGAWFADLGFFLFGTLAYLFPIMIALSGIRLFWIGGQKPWENRLRRFLLSWIGFVLLLGVGVILADRFADLVPVSLINGPGGGLGQFFHAQLAQRFTPPQGTALLGITAFIALSLLFGFSWLRLLDHLGEAVLALLRWIRSAWRQREPVQGDGQHQETGPES